MSFDIFPIAQPAGPGKPHRVVSSSRSDRLRCLYSAPSKVLPLGDEASRIVPLGDEASRTALLLRISCA